MSSSYGLDHQLPRAKVPFSWELKPGVSRQDDDKTGEIWKRQWKLPPPPCQTPTPTPTSSFRRHDGYGDDVLGSPLVICPLKPFFRVSKSRDSSFRKNGDDPFVEALRKCGEFCPNGLSLDKNDAKCGKNNEKKIKKRGLAVRLWGKYSCKVGTDGFETGSEVRKPIPNQRKDVQSKRF